MASDRSTKASYDSNHFTNNVETVGNYFCFYCKGHMPWFKGAAHHGKEEGHGQKLICAQCKYGKPSVSVPSPPDFPPQSSDVSITPVDVPSSVSPFGPPTNVQSKSLPLETNNDKPKKLPTNLTKRDPFTINFNKMILQQIKNDGNFKHAFKAEKKGKLNYFTYLTKVIIPKHYDTNEYSMFKDKNLKRKFIKFIKFAETKSNDFYLTDSIRTEGESIDSDVELFLQMAEEDGVTQKGKTSENASNQMSFIDNTDRSQVASGNKSDHYSNIDNANMVPNLTPGVSTATHQQVASTKQTPSQKRKKKSSRIPSSDLVFERLDYLERKINQFRNGGNIPLEVRLGQTIKNLLNLQKVERISTNAIDLAIISNLREVIKMQAESYYDSVLEDVEETKRKKQRCNNDSSVNDDDSDGSGNNVCDV